MAHNQQTLSLVPITSLKLYQTLYVYGGMHYLSSLLGITLQTYFSWLVLVEFRVSRSLYS